VGSATLAAFTNAGGLGQVINTGIAERCLRPEAVDPNPYREEVSCARYVPF
jgi:hypothetical protein